MNQKSPLFYVLIAIYVLVGILGITLVATLVFGDKDSNKEQTEITTYADDDDESEPSKLVVESATCPYTMSPQGANSYWETNMFDGNPRTAWSISLDQTPRSNGYIEGPVITLSRPARISHIVIRNGYCKSTDLFYKNSRINHIRLINANSLDDGTHQVIIDDDIDDSQSAQTVNVLPSAKNTKVSKLQIIIPNDNIVWGNRWDDLCISELEIWGK